MYEPQVIYDEDEDESVLLIPLYFCAGLFYIYCISNA